MVTMAKNRGQSRTSRPHKLTPPKKMISPLTCHPPTAVLSFMSNFSNRDARSSKTPSPPGDTIPFPSFPEKPEQQQDGYRSSSPQRGPQQPSNIRGSPTRREQVQRNRANSRPMSMVQTYQPPLMELGQDTLPELQPVFTYLNSHSNKLYQEGYFLKLDDQNSRMFSFLFIFLFFGVQG